MDWPTEDGAYYTLVMIDPDAPSRKDPSFGECKHWLVMNIPGSVYSEPDVSKGETLSTYKGSGPPKDTGYHRYVFLVYKQLGVINTNDKSPKAARPKFKVRTFAKQYNLGEPIAINYFQAQYDKGTDPVG